MKILLALSVFVLIGMIRYSGYLKIPVIDQVYFTDGVHKLLPVLSAIPIPTHPSTTLPAEQQQEQQQHPTKGPKPHTTVPYKTATSTNNDDKEDPIDRNTSNNETKTATSTNNDDQEDPTDRNTSNSEIKMATTSTTHDTEAPTKMRLELLHIQKNAGTLLEVVASRHNISWGACHFTFPWKTRAKQFNQCPAVAKSISSKEVYWHWPLQHVDIHHYDNLQDIEYAKRPKRFFVVIRNPYDRLISLFYMNNSNKQWGFYNENNMNSYIQKTLHNPKTVGLTYHNASLCQYHYVFDQNNTQMVDHMVQFEYLSEDFNLLSQTYGLNITIPKEEMINVNLRKRNEVQKMTVHNLTRTTRVLINSMCANDFQLVRGYQLLN